jgi:glycosyltransferase involved in cell wall biosynthesis
MPELERRARIGIWIELPPVQLDNEGIGRLLQVLVEHSARLGQEFVFACPSWYRPHLESYLADFDVPSREGLSIISARKEPSFFVRFKKRKKAKEHRSWWQTSLRELKARLKTPLLSWASRQSLPMLILTGLLLSPIVIPVLLLVVCYLASELLRSVVLHSDHPILAGMRQNLRWIKRFYTQWLSGLIAQLHAQGIEEEYRQLAKLATSKNDVRSWFVPNPSWHRASLIDKPLVVAFPDYVPEDLPLSFIGQDAVTQKRQIASLLQSAHSVITYREYVRDEHLNKLFGFPKEKTFVIPHAPFDLSDYLNRSPEFSEDTNRQIAADRVREFFAKRFLSDPGEHWFHANYLPDFAFEDAQFILLSTRFRNYKNILRAVEAVEILLRERMVNIKLFVTGTFEEEISKYVSEKSLAYDLIQLWYVPADVLACLYYLAQVAIHPSFFEGGFPFTFSEGVSVGTPVLLAKLPYVTEVLREELHSEFVFDAYSATDIADKIQYALRNRDALLMKQRKILQTQSNWNEVAQQYLDVFHLSSAVNGQDHINRTGTSIRPLIRT